MKNYNVLYTFFGLLIICCYSFCMKQPKQLPHKLSKQLIVTHNIQKQEKQLLQDIMEGYPQWIQLNPSYQQTMQETNFSIYTPTYFKDFIQILEGSKETGTSAQTKKTLENQAILYITYVAMNNQLWSTIEDKLIYIHECFQQYTLPYLQATWERYKPTMVIATTPSIAEELPYEKGTVEEVSSEEEETTILEQPISSTSTSYEKKINPSRRQLEKSKTKLPTRKEPKKQPNIIYRTINFIWNGISSVFTWIFSWFK